MKHQNQEALQKERNMLSNQWKREEEQEKEMERQKFVLNRERNLDLIKHNEAEKQLRDTQIAAEKDRDKHMLNAALDREAALLRLEQAEKEARRGEIVELQKHYFKQAADKKAEEQYIEHLT